VGSHSILPSHDKRQETVHPPEPRNGADHALLDTVACHDADLVVGDEGAQGHEHAGKPLSAPPTEEERQESYEQRAPWSCQSPLEFGHVFRIARRQQMSGGRGLSLVADGQNPRDGKVADEAPRPHSRESSQIPENTQVLEDDSAGSVVRHGQQFRSPRNGDEGLGIVLYPEKDAAEGAIGAVPFPDIEDLLPVQGFVEARVLEIVQGEFFHDSGLESINGSVGRRTQPKGENAREQGCHDEQKSGAPRHSAIGVTARIHRDQFAASVQTSQAEDNRDEQRQRKQGLEGDGRLVEDEARHGLGREEAGRRITQEIRGAVGGEDEAQQGQDQEEGLGHFPHEITIEQLQEPLPGTKPSLRAIVRHEGRTRRDSRDLLQANELRKSYRRREVVAGVSIRVDRQEVVGLLGPNGAGKTTTFRMVVGLVPADGGSILLDGDNLAGLPVHARAVRGLGYLPQEASVFRGLNVADNIRVALELRPDLDRRGRRAELNRWMEELQIGHLGQRAATSLSGGERRRVEIARALAARPRYLLLDEPFAAIDPIAVAEIRRIVRHLTDRGIGVLVTDHNVRETLDVCDRAYIMDRGRILAEGSPEEILADPKVREVYLGEDFKL